MCAAERQVGSRPLPLLTAAMVGAAVCAHAFPAAGASFVYDRGLIASGQAWRLWTGHLAHHGLPHLLWNLAVFALAAGWLETVRPRLARTFLATAPLLIALVLFAADPSLQRYAGLSGVAAGSVTLLALVQLVSDRAGRGLWAGVLVLVAGKIVYETVYGGSLAAELPPGIRNVPLAHLAGVGSALAFSIILLPRNPS